MSHVISHMSCVTFHVSHVMCHMSCVTCHVSHVMCHVSHVMCHVSHVTCHFFFGEAYWGRVCYQRGLPCLVISPGLCYFWGVTSLGLCLFLDPGTYGNLGVARRIRHPVSAEVQLIADTMTYSQF